MQVNFAGKEYDAHIKRENVPYLEHSLGRGLYAVLKDFTDGLWTFNDVAMVVSFALHGPTKDDALTMSFARQAAKAGLPMGFSLRYRPHPDVIAVMQREGHGNYAELAADILTEAVFGPVVAEGADDAA